MSQLHIDSLYSKFIQINAPEYLPESNQPVEITLEDRKCGFGIVSDVKSNFEFFSSEQQVVLHKILSRPMLQTSIVSPSGYFRIHYDQTGFNRPSYVTGLTPDQNAAEVAEALDSVYRFEVDYLGYLPPVNDGTAGGDDKYDIYIQELSGLYYGYTEWENKVGSNNWTSFMVIDNDYIEFISTRLNGMKVTVAHEFHHGIQLGSYSIADDNSPFRSADVFFYELTSTSMEEFVYDNVNDYYAYMSSYFRDPERPMPNQNGYNMAIWNIYMQENFGFEIIKQQWELIPSIKAMLAINNTIFNAGSSFPGELNKFGIWTYYTNSRAIPGSYFEEAANYPLITPTTELNFTPPQQTANMTSRPAANNFLKFNIFSAGDTLFSLVTNGDAFAASENPNQIFNFQYTLFTDTISGTRKLTDDYSSTFVASNPSYWSVSEILNNLLVRSDSVIIPTININESLAYPNPFKYGVASNLNIAIEIKSGTKVDFQVYTSGLKLVYSATKDVGFENNSANIEWDGLDNNKKRLGSGVYIYVVQQGDEVVKGKVVIFNE